ncbi:type II toxin-antitoxin system RelE/ParE family toxin [Frankia sp. Cas3]|uniref:type II toxin-antitoxin system RelE family toxin n=1 Tax=Frankia sp. Cas3 TaxID=3073926 RepID=UPI002AD3B2BB|nr:type II toxin-antitoxin system RelE/ParE family toxin [Frankia sp. Cas3]
MTADRYRLRIARAAARALAETLPEKVAVAAYEFITGVLLDTPYRVGKMLDPPLAPLRSARRGAYRIIYLIDEASHTVEVTAVRHRSDAYHT